MKALFTILRSIFIDLYSKNTFKYTLFGVVFGLFFPVIAIVFELVEIGLTFSISSIVALHKTRHLIWIIDTAPIFLGAFAYLTGKYVDNYLKTASNLSVLHESHRKAIAEHIKIANEKSIILESVTEFISFQDRDMNIIWANRAAIESGESKHKNVIGRPCYKTWEKHSRPCEDCPVKLAIETGKPHNKEKVSYGGKIWHIKGFPVFDNDGNVQGAVEIANEITDKVKLESKLKESEEQYRSLIERASDGIFIIYKKNIVFANPSFVTLLGYKYEEVINKRATKILHPDDRERLEKNYIARMSGQEVPSIYEASFMTKDGIRIEVEINAGKITYADGEADLVFVRDISERKQAERALREAEERYRELIENMNEVVYTLNDEGNVEYISPAIKYIADYNPTEMIDKRFTEFIHPEDVGEVKNAIISVLSNGAVAIECRLITRFSGICWVRLSAKPYYENRVITGVQGLMIDITNQRAAELALFNSEKRYRAVTEVTSDFAYSFRIDNNEQLHLDWVAGALRQITGFTPEEIISGGGFMKRLIHPDDQLKVEARVKRLLNNQEDISEFRIITKEGKEKYLRHIGRPVWDAKISRVVEIISAAKDVTEQVLADQARRESEERLSLALEAADEGLWDWDFVNNKAYFSSRYYTMLGYEPNEFPADRYTWINLLHPDDKMYVVQEIDDSISRQENSFSIEFRLRTKSGQWMWVLGSGMVVKRDKEGRPLRMVGTHVNISKIKQTQEELLTNEMKFRALFENANDFILLLAPRGVAPPEIIESNRRVQEITGYSKYELIGEPISILDYNVSFSDIFKRQVAFLTGRTKYITFETMLKRKDGQMIPVEVSSTSFKLNNERFMIVFGRDISERRKAEQALRESEETFRTITSSANDAIVMMNDRGEISFWNERAEILFGYNRNEIIGRDLHRILAPDEYLVGFIKAFPRFRESGNGAAIGKTIELVAKKKDGSEFSIELSLATLKLKNRWQAVGIIRDITDRKKAEEQRIKLQHQLERAERIESLGMLAGGIAHDLNNMLGPLVGYSDLILTQIERDNPLRKKIERIHNVSQNAADIIQDLLTMARRGRYEMAPINLNDVVKEYLESPGFIHRTKQYKNIEVTINLHGDDLNIMGSTPHLGKAVMNLVVNAFDAMPDGGQLGVETSMVYLDSLSNSHKRIVKGHYAMLKVSDTGTGIDAEDINKIFEPYYSKKKLGASGSGLGLAVVYGLVMDHKGYYDLISEVGKGTTFILYFPITEKVHELKQESVGDYRGDETILVVDDMAEQRELTSELLKSFGYKVKTVSNGREAIAYFTENTADLVVLDMIMEPDYDGLDTYKDILQLHPGQKAIIVSGFSATKRVNEMQSLGAGPYLKKPFTRNKIGRAVRQVLDEKSPKTEITKA